MHDRRASFELKLTDHVEGDVDFAIEPDHGGFVISFTASDLGSLRIILSTWEAEALLKDLSHFVYGSDE